MGSTHAIERAFELARTGKCRSLTEIRTKLKSEGLDGEQIQGRVLMSQLRKLLKTYGSASTAAQLEPR